MLVISTTKLQEMVSKAIKGVGTNKLIPRTMDMAIRVKDNVLTLLTSDADNYLTITENVESEDFYAVIQADQFAKLVMRTTSETITLDRESTNLVVKGNGTCTFPLEIDSNSGDVVDYPNPLESIVDVQQQSIGKIDVNTIGTILSAVKPAVALGDEIPHYKNYYLGDVVLATDTFKVACLKKQITSTPILVSARLMELLDVYKSENPMSIYKVGERLVFMGDNVIVCGYAMEGIEQFALDKMNAFLERQYPNSCVLPKQSLLQLLDRLSLFVGVFDDGVINLAFNDKEVEVSSQKSDSVEVLPYTSSAVSENQTVKIYLEMFKSQIKAQTGDNVEVYFGDGASVKLVDNNIDVVSIVSIVA